MVGVSTVLNPERFHNKSTLIGSIHIHPARQRMQSIMSRSLSIDFRLALLFESLRCRASQMFSLEIRLARTTCGRQALGLQQLGTTCERQPARPVNRHNNQPPVFRLFTAICSVSPLFNVAFCLSFCFYFRDWPCASPRQPPAAALIRYYLLRLQSHRPQLVATYSELVNRFLHVYRLRCNFTSESRF